MPSRWAISTTASGPMAFTRRAYTVFVELYVAESSVLSPLPDDPPALLTVQKVPSGGQGVEHSIFAGLESSQ